MTVTLERVGAVALVTIDDPATRNALTADRAGELCARLAEVDADPGVAALVLRGAGGHFCSGADRSVLSRARDDPGDPAVQDGLGAIYRTFVQLGELGVPTVAAVRGAAVGAGLNLALAADVRIVATTARLLSGFLRIGLHPGGGHFLLLDRLAGPQTTVAMTLLGEEVAGTRAVELGLAHAAVPDEEVEAYAMGLAGRAADPWLSRAATRSFRAQARSRQAPWELALRAEEAAQLASFHRPPPP